jgi:phospholipid/cholesterol/gamma-HCH transport system substrate-binding protein
MKAKQSRRAVIVGIFILIGVTIFIGAILVVGGQRKTFGKGVVVKAIFDDVNGLQAGDNVWFSGVKVGIVKNIQLLKNSKVEADMNIYQKSRPFIHEDAKAKIGSEGLIGNKIVIIYGGTVSIPSVKANDVLQVESVLKTQDIVNTLQENNKNLLAITADFKLISERLANGEGSIGKLLTDDQLANQLQATASILKNSSSNLQTLTANVEEYTAKLQTKGVLANELVTDTTLFQSLKLAAAQIKQASDNAKVLTANLADVTQKIQDSANTAGVLLNDERTAANLKATIENLQSGTKKFDEDMEALQHNFLLRGFFRKKEKREKKEQSKQVANDTHQK